MPLYNFKITEKYFKKKIRDLFQLYGCIDLVWYSREIKDNIMGSIFKTLPHRCLDATYGVVFVGILWL